MKALSTFRAIALFATVAVVTPVQASTNGQCDFTCRESRGDVFSPDAVRQLSDAIAPVAPAVVWQNDSKAFYYARTLASDVVLYKVDPIAQTRQEVIRASTILARADVKGVPAGSLPAAALSVDGGGQRVRLSIGEEQLTYALADNTVSRSRPDRHAATSPDGQYNVWTKDHNLYSSTADGDAVQLSNDGELWRSFSSGMADTQPTDIAAITGNADARAPRIGWIGSGTKFYIQRQDLRTTGDLWQIDSLAQPRPRLITQKMPLPGEANLPVSELWIFDAQGGPAVRVDTGDWVHVGNLDPGQGGIWPSRDGRTLYFARMTRGYSAVELCAADVATGRVRVILREAPSDGWSVRFADFRELENGFLWRSDRSGFQHYGFYDWSGRLVRDVTPGNTSAWSILDISPDGRKMIYTAFDDARYRNPAQFRIHIANIGTGKSRPLDREDAHHEVTFAPNGQHYVDAFSRPDLAPTMVVRDRAGAIIMTVESSDTSALERSGWRAPARIRTLAADKATPLYGWLWLPEKNNDKGSLPVVADVYPGPSIEMGPIRFDPDNPNGRLAAAGFAVLNIGQRGGTFIRGKRYQHYPFEVGSVRDYPIADNKAAIRGVASQFPVIDLDRVGIIGHSGGGLMAATAMMLAPDFYKVGVASAGNHDNNLYEMGSGEFNFGDPLTGPAGSPDGYATNQALAPRLQGKLLLIHGALDNDVPLGNTMRLSDALIKAGKNFDLLILPSQRHGFRGVDREYVRRKTLAYLLEHLDGVEPPVDLLPTAPSGQ
ncbi:S9 family peptidase [Tsuneonella suprasediminis]|uniref:S9 family peptidase n=1 Tax=Tsuneonella suprasediminis TaxID=2306996 RepID=UPI002F95367C